MRLLACLVALSLCLGSLPATHAIIMRHDQAPGAYQVSASEFPAVFFLDQQGRRKVCAATLIDPLWAVTAAHCVAEARIQQRLAESPSITVSLAGARREIVAVALHPRHPPTEGLDVDLALLRFAEPVPYPRPVPLYRGQGEQDAVVTLLGWGYAGIGTQGRQFDDGRLRRAENRVARVGAWLEMDFDDPRTTPSALMLEGMPGLGDSGGPALWWDDSGVYLMGVAVGEWMGDDFDEETQGQYGAIAVYERVSRHVDWFDQIMTPPSSGQ